MLAKVYSLLKSRAATSETEVEPNSAPQKPKEKGSLIEWEFIYWSVPITDGIELKTPLQVLAFQKRCFFESSSIILAEKMHNCSFVSKNTGYYSSTTIWAHVECDCYKHTHMHVKTNGFFLSRKISSPRPISQAVLPDCNCQFVLALKIFFLIDSWVCLPHTQSVRPSV